MVVRVGARRALAGVPLAPACASLACVCVFVFGGVPSFAQAEVCPNAAFRSGPSESLPDCRVYEMVSPLDSKDGNVYAPNGGLREGLTPTEQPFVVAADGDAVAYAADPVDEGNGSMGQGRGNTFVATRDPDGGWTAVDQQPPGHLSVEYEGFSEDLSTGILDTCVEPVLAAGAPSGGYAVIYSHRTADRGPEGYSALLTVKPPERPPCEPGGTMVPSGFGTEAPGSNAPLDTLLYAGGTPDLGHVLFYANDALTGNAPPTAASENDLYENVGGALRLVNVLPGQVRGEPDASFGSPWELSEGAGSSWSGPPDFSRAISDDGSRVFWTDLKNRDLYVRENGAQSVQVDAAEPGCSFSCESGGGWFWTASSDGQRVFFTDCRRLTVDSTAVPSGGCGVPGEEYDGPRGNDLYEWNEGKLTDLTIDHNASDPLGANVQGVIGASEDGEYVYFVADGVLAGNENGNEETARAESPNLYVYHEGATAFIATLAVGDDSNGVWAIGAGRPGHSGDWMPGLVGRTAEATPAGGAVVFMSTRALTRDADNVVGGVAHDEVYVYDAQTNGLSCVSCDPSGAPPSVTPSSALTSYLPVSTHYTYVPRWISDDGDRVFFDTVEPLVAGDVNGKLDVYEWERDGAGSCRDEAGCVYMISGGGLTYTEDTEDGSALVGTDASGENVFFVTRDQLVAQDRDELVSLYDARVDGVQPPTPPICTGSGCQGVPSAPPLFEVPPSATFSGIGNLEPPAPAAKPRAKPLTRAQKLAKALRACAKQPKRQRAGCRAQAKKRYGASGAKAKKSSVGGRRTHV